jgi:hypothetical protein
MRVAAYAVSVGSALEVGRSRGMVLSLLYWALRRLLELLVLRMRSERAKEIEILVLRHQLQLLERQVASAQFMREPHARLSLVVCSRLLERRERMVLAQELREQRHREVELTPARAPDQALLNQRVAVHGDAALIPGSIAGRDDPAIRTSSRSTTSGP